MNAATSQTFQVFLENGRRATVAVRAENRGCSFTWALTPVNPSREPSAEFGGGAGCKDSARALASALSELTATYGSAIAVLAANREHPPRLRVVA